MSKPTESASQTPPSDIDAYMTRIKKRASPAGEIVDEIADAKVERIKSLVQDARLKQAEKDAKTLMASGGEERNVTQAIANLFQNRSIEEVQQFLSELTPEMYAGLQRIANLGGQGGGGPLIVKEDGKSDFQEKVLLALINKPAPQQDLGALFTGMAKMIEVSRPAPAPVIQPAPVQPQMNPLDMFKIVAEVTKPYQEGMSKAQREANEARMKELEAKMPADFKDQISYVKEMAPILGLDRHQTSELDLKLEEMKQNREVDLKKLDWEQRRYEMEQDADSHKWDQITNILQGPVGEVVKSLGNAGAARVRGPNASNAGGKLPRAVQTQCPQCGKPIFVDADAETAICGNCGAVLQRQSGTPAPAQPSATRVEEQPEEQPAEQEEEQEEEQETGHKEAEQQPAPAKPKRKKQ